MERTGGGDWEVSSSAQVVVDGLWVDINGEKKGGHVLDCYDVGVQ